MLEIHPLVDYHLKNWAYWMRHPGIKLDYPSKSAGFITGGVSGVDGFDHWADGCDSEAVIIINRLIDDLEPDESAAINHIYLRAVYRLRDPESSFERAIGKIFRGMVKEGLA